MGLGFGVRVTWAELFVPVRASVAIAVSSNSVEPAPVEVQRYRSVLDDARCVGEACRHWKRWVDLCDIFPFLLRKREQRKCGDGKSGGAHCPAFVKEFVKEFENWRC